MDLLALCLAAICVIYANAKEKLKTGHYPSNLDIACKQLAPSTCPAHGNWTSLCPREFKVKGDNGRSTRFKIKLHKELRKWDEALKVCQSEGGTLAMPKTKKKQNVIKQKSRRSSIFDLEAWIGMKDVDGNNTYQWIDGEPLSYTYWRPGEPNSPDERCVTNIASYITNDGWHDLNCEYKRVFICQ